MTRLLLPVAAGVLGAALGAAAALALQSPPAPRLQAAPPPVALSPDEDRSEAPDQTRVLLVWAAGGLPEGFDDKVAAVRGVRTVSEVRAGRVELLRSSTAAGETVDRFAAGWTVPLDAFGITPRTHRRLAPSGARDLFTALRPGTVLLGATSARLRRVDVGDSLTLGGEETFTVAGIADDTLVAAAEVVLTRRDAVRVGVVAPRFLLVEYSGARPRVEAAIRGAAPPGIVLRIRGPGEAPYLRHGDAVLPQAVLKEVFGEFAYRPGPGRSFKQEPAWERTNIVAARVPILGTIRCHRVVVDALRGAMRALEQRGLDHLLDPDEYRGCWNPRHISAGGALSRHAWGIAVDLNAGANPTGIGSGQDPRLVDVMERWGFTWGGFWLIPDPMHFEYLRPPDP